MTPGISLRKLISFAFLFAIVFCSSGLVWGQSRGDTGAINTVAAKQETDSPAITELSPAALEAFNRGKAAARAGDWTSALGHFSKAHEAFFLSPQVLYAMAVALKNLKYPVPAAVFFNAYLEAWPDAPNAERVKEEVLDQEVVIGQLVKDLFNEASVIIDKIPDQKERQEARLVVIEKMAWAGEMDLARKMALEYPVGMPLILGEICLKISRVETTGPFIDANECFKLAENLIPAEAALTAEDKFSYMAVPAIASDLHRHREEQRRKLPELKRLVEAEGLIRLSISMNRAGYHEGAFMVWKKGADLFRQNELQSMFRLPGSDKILNAHTNAGVIFMDRTGNIGRLFYSASKAHSYRNYNPSGYGFIPSNVRPNSILVRPMPNRWVVLAKNWGYRQSEEDLDFALNLSRPDLKDPAFTDLVVLIKRLKRGSLNQIPVVMAELGLKYAGALYFLKTNHF